MNVKNGIIVEAKLLSETKQAWFLDLEGDKEWFPKQYCTFDEEKEELTAPSWILKTKFPNENY